MSFILFFKFKRASEIYDDNRFNAIFNVIFFLMQLLFIDYKPSTLLILQTTTKTKLLLFFHFNRFFFSLINQVLNHP